VASQLSTIERGNRAPVLLGAEDVEAAGNSARLLVALLDSKLPGSLTARMFLGQKNEVEISLPQEAVVLLAEMLAQLAEGHAVHVVPVQAELTTQQAADLLGVSRPYLIGVIERGEIAHRRVGNRRRIPLSDLLRYQQLQDYRNRLVVAALTEQAEELGLGYDD
jgi:excisionase family DNA binding protein